MNPTPGQINNYGKYNNGAQPVKYFGAFRASPFEDVFDCNKISFYVSPGVGVSAPKGILTGSLLCTSGGSFYSSSVPTGFAIVEVSELGWKVEINVISFRLTEDVVIRTEINWSF